MQDGQREEEECAGSLREIGPQLTVGRHEVFFYRQRGDTHRFGGFLIGLAFQLDQLVGSFLLFGELFDGLLQDLR